MIEEQVKEQNGDANIAALIVPTYCNSVVHFICLRVLRALATKEALL